MEQDELSREQDLLDAVGINALYLPKLSEWKRGQTGLVEDYTKRWPDLEHVPFFLSVGDGAAATVGSGCVDESRVALTIGTTGALRILTDNPVINVPKGLWAYRLGRSRTLLGGSFSEGGNVIQWALNNLNLPPLENLNRELERLQPTSHGIDVLPFIAGERSTGWSTSATGVIRGITQSTEPILILQAMSESG